MPGDFDVLEVPGLGPPIGDASAGAEVRRLRELIEERGSTD